MPNPLFTLAPGVTGDTSDPAELRVVVASPVVITSGTQYFLDLNEFSSSPTHVAYATKGRTTGNWYFEVTHPGSISIPVIVGVGNAASITANNDIGGVGSAGGVTEFPEEIRANGVARAPSAEYPAVAFYEVLQTPVGVMFDADARTIRFFSQDVSGMVPAVDGNFATLPVIDCSGQLGVEAYFPLVRISSGPPTRQYPGQDLIAVNFGETAFVSPGVLTQFSAEPFNGFSNVGGNGNVSISAPSPTLLAGGGGQGFISAPAPTIFAAGGGFAALVVPTPTIFAASGGQVSITAPAARLISNGRSSLGDNSADFTAPVATLAAFGGGGMIVDAPAAQLSVAGTFTGWGKIALEAPSATLSATGTTSATASAALEAPTARLVGYGGAVASITLTGKNTIQATGTTGGIGGAALTVPLFQLVAGAKAENYGGANLLAPSPRMGDRLQAWLTAPSARLTAIGSATITATYEAYSVNLNHVSDGGGDKKETTIDEVTRYTNFPFTHVVRYQNSYYGANSTGLYLLEGATDDTAPISWAVTTGMMEFGSPKMKTVASAYFGGRFGPASTITLSAGEKTPAAYSFSTPRDALAKNHRQVFGRGVKARYYTLAVSGEGECELDDITFGIHTTTRRI